MPFEGSPRRPRNAPTPAATSHHTPAKTTTPSSRRPAAPTVATNASALADPLNRSVAARRKSGKRTAGRGSP